MMKIYQDHGYATQRFQRVHRHDLWQGDIKYGVMLNIGGKQVQTYFSCLIDDATRYILHGEFSPNMEQGIVEDTLHKAIIKYGAPKRLYFDNGSQYRTHWMKRACGLMGIRLLYAKPRNPQGKGKQERFNQTLDAFLDEISLNIPDDLALALTLGLAGYSLTCLLVLFAHFLTGAKRGFKLNDLFRLAHNYCSFLNVVFLL